MATKTLERLQVLLTADDSNLKGTLGKAAGRMEGFGNKLRGLKAVAAPVAGAFAAVGAAALASAVKAGRMADELLDLSQQTGLTTDQLQEYRRVTNQAGVDTDAVARAAEQMTLRFSRGAEGSADLRQGLAQLGISAKDAQGNMRPMGEIVDEAIVGLAGMEDATQRNILATKLFSRGATDLAPVLGMGADEIKRLREEAHEMGLVIGEDGLQQANDFRASYDSLQQVLGNVANQIGVQLAPTFQTLAERIQTDWIPVIKSVAGAFAFVVESAAGFLNNIQRIWVGIQGIFLHGVRSIVDAFANLTSAIPFLGEKIDVARDKFNTWANVEMLNLKARMDDLNASTVGATSAIRDQTTAAGENAAALASMASSGAKAAEFEAVEIKKLDNTLQELSLTHQDLETVAVGTSSNIQIKSGTAFQQMADTVAANAGRVLGAVQRVLQKLSGGGGFLGGITGAIGGFLSGGPLGGALGFAGGIGLFADGGTIRAGDIGIVGEAGPEIVSGPAHITPTDGMTLRIDPSSIPAPPPAMTPEGAALNAWWRQLFSELVLDGKARGVL